MRVSRAERVIGWRTRDPGLPRLHSNVGCGLLIRRDPDARCMRAHCHNSGHQPRSFITFSLTKPPFLLLVFVLVLSMDPPSSSSSVRHSLRPFALKNPSTYPKRNSDFFRSRLPNDPFSNSALRGRAPIVINSERLHRAVSDSHVTRHVILVLGGQ